MNTYDIAGTGKIRTVQQWAKQLGCNPATLRRAIQKGELLATRNPLSRGHPQEIEPADMRAFLEKRRVGRR